LGVGQGLTTPTIKLNVVTKHYTHPWAMPDCLAQPKHCKLDMRFGTWNVWSLYRSGSLKMVARKLGKYKLDLVGVQEVRWDKSGTEWAEDYTFFYGATHEDHQ
jgi:hypothetical protein